MASVHIPIFMDGKLYTKYQGKRYIDVILLFLLLLLSLLLLLLLYHYQGCFWSFIRNKDVFEIDNNLETKWSKPFTVDWKNDNKFSEKINNYCYIHIIKIKLN